MGRVQADVWGLIDGAALLAHDNIAAQFDIVSAKGLPPLVLDANRRWIATNLQTRSLAYNTSLISAADVPRTHKDLLNPRWKGQMVWHPYALPGSLGFIGVEHGLGPADEELRRPPPRAELGRDRPPRGPVPMPPDDRLDSASQVVVLRLVRRAALLDQRCQLIPLSIGQNAIAGVIRHAPNIGTDLKG